MNRHTLRKQLRAQRQHINATQQRQAATLITQQLTALPIFKQSYTIAGYYAQGQEVNPQPLLEEAWTHHKTCYLPLLQTEEAALLFARYRLGDTLQLNPYGIAEPLPYQIIAPEALDMVLLPLIGFDLEGHRLGSGKGYYDRTFSFLTRITGKKPYLVGLAYECQKTKTFLPEKWDIPMDAVVTEERMYIFS